MEALQQLAGGYDPTPLDPLSFGQHADGTTDSAPVSGVWTF
jgi:hypothetical protein